MTDKLRILIIYPRDYGYRTSDSSYRKSANYAGLTLTTLAGLVPDELNADIRILDEGVDDTEIDYDVDIIAISTLTSSAKRAYNIADIAREKGIYVVLGGYHVSYNYEEGIKHADTVIIGQADNTWPKFLFDYVKGKPKRKYEQIGKIDLRNLPWPKRELLKKNKYFILNSIQTSRGCPNKCKFCTVSDNMMFGENRPVSDVVEEIKSFKGKEFIFLDPNFTANKEYAIELMEELKALNKRWGCLTTIDTGKSDEMLKMMKDSGCIGVLIGVETICQANMINMNKSQNKVLEYKEMIENFHKYGMSILACFVLGFDDDDTSVFEKTVDFINDSGIDLVRFSTLTPFPGTPYYNELKKEGRIIEDNTDYYDFQNVVFEPKKMSAEELQRGLEYCWKETYRISNILKRVYRGNNKLLLLILSFGFRTLGLKLLRRSKR